MITEFAPAKVNLALHVTGRRDDGYHLLDSLVVFAAVGDKVTVAAADGLHLSVAGLHAASLPATGDNLVLRAARAFGTGQGAMIGLNKVLPVASGIGGGSADAAATLRALSQLWGVDLPPAASILTLGADVPVCLASKPARMTGIGDVVTPMAYDLPPAWLVLVNPHIALPTPAVFAALTIRENPGLPSFAHWPDALALARWLQNTRNDLEGPATTVAPQIAAVKAALNSTNDCLLARMSGSGATCFGLYPNAISAGRAATNIASHHPVWWVRSAPILP